MRVLFLCFALAALRAAEAALPASVWQQKLDNAWVSSVFESMDHHTYVAGKFSGTAAFSATESRSTSYAFEGFLAKYRSADGVLVWVQLLGEEAEPSILGQQPRRKDAASGVANFGAIVVAGTRHSTGATVLGEFKGALRTPLPASPGGRSGFVARVSVAGEVLGAMQLAQAAPAASGGGSSGATVGVGIGGGHVQMGVGADGSVAVSGHLARGAAAVFSTPGGAAAADASKCYWSPLRGTALPEFFDAGSSDIDGYSPHPTPLDAESKCAALCEGVAACVGYSWRNGGASTHAKFRRCWLVSRDGGEHTASSNMKSALCNRGGLRVACPSFTAAGTCGFVAKLSEELLPHWAVPVSATFGAKGAAAAFHDNGMVLACGAYDPRGAALQVGAVSAHAKLAPAYTGGGTAAAASEHDAWVAQIGPTGKPLWATRIGSQGSAGQRDACEALATQVDGSAAVVGRISGIDVRFGDEHNVTTRGASPRYADSKEPSAAFIAGIDSAGNFTWVVAGEIPASSGAWAQACTSVGGTCTPQMKGGEQLPFGWGHSAFRISTAPDGSYLVSGSFQWDIEFGVVAPSGLACTTTCSSGTPCGNACIAASSSCSKTVPGNACYAAQTLTAAGTQDAFIVHVSKQGAVSSAVQVGGADETIASGVPIDQYRAWVYANPRDGSYSYGGIFSGTAPVGVGGAALVSASRPYSSYFAHSTVDSSIIVPVTLAPTPVPPTPPTPPTPRPTAAPTPEPTPSPTPKDLPFCAPENDGQCVVLANRFEGDAVKQVTMCRGAKKLVTWEQTGKSWQDPYPDLSIQCKGWAHGGWGVNKAFGTYGITDCNAASPFVATRAHMYKRAGACYTGYFDCIQCAPVVPTPPPTPSALATIIKGTRIGDEKALIIAGVAVAMFVCMCIGFAAALAKYRNCRSRCPCRKKQPNGGNGGGLSTKTRMKAEL